MDPVTLAIAKNDAATRYSPKLHKNLDKDFNAVGDGTTDDRAAFLAAAAAFGTSPGVLSLTPGKTYKVGSQTNFANLSNVTIEGNGAKIVGATDGAGGIYGAGGGGGGASVNGSASGAGGAGGSGIVIVTSW